MTHNSIDCTDNSVSKIIELIKNSREDDGVVTLYGLSYMKDDLTYENLLKIIQFLNEDDIICIQYQKLSHTWFFPIYHLITAICNGVKLKNVLFYYQDPLTGDVVNLKRFITHAMRKNIVISVHPYFILFERREDNCIYQNTHKYDLDDNIDAWENKFVSDISAAIIQNVFHNHICDSRYYIFSSDNPKISYSRCYKQSIMNGWLQYINDYPNNEIILKTDGNIFTISHKINSVTTRYLTFSETKVDCSKDVPIDITYLFTPHGGYYVYDLLKTVFGTQ